MGKKGFKDLIVWQKARGEWQEVLIVVKQSRFLAQDKLCVAILLITVRLLRHFTPRNDTLLNAFVLAMGKRGFKELNVCQKSKDLVVFVYKLTTNGSFKKDYGLRDQMRRAAVSIPSNIAEGDERGTDKESVRYFYIAKGSSAELLTQVIISHEIGYISKDTFNELEHKCTEISKMLSKLISVRSRTFCP